MLSDLFETCTVEIGAVNYLNQQPSLAGVPVRLGAAGGDANISLSLTPKGTGALAAQNNDGTAAGGNVRGANAVDWQQVRSLASQVAAGSRAVIGGGVNNTAGGSSATVGGGDSNNAPNTGTTVAGGRGNTAGGVDAWVPGGYQATTRGRVGSGAWASGQFASLGDAQSAELVLRRQTTDTTPLALTTDNAAPGTSNQIVVPDGSTVGGRHLAFEVEPKDPVYLIT